MTDCTPPGLPAIGDGMVNQLLAERDALRAEVEMWKAAADEQCRGKMAFEREAVDLRAERDELLKKQEVWLMSPEAAQRLDGYRELSMKLMKAEDEAAALKAELARFTEPLTDEEANRAHKKFSFFAYHEYPRLHPSFDDIDRAVVRAMDAAIREVRKEKKDAGSL